MNEIREFWISCNMDKNEYDKVSIVMNREPDHEDCLRPLIHVLEATPLTKNAGELLEALKKIASEDYRGNKPEHISIAQSAIAKVEGAANEKV